jgi:hypothetical protein
VTEAQGIELQRLRFAAQLFQAAERFLDAGEDPPFALSVIGTNGNQARGTVFRADDGGLALDVQDDSTGELMFPLLCHLSSAEAVQPFIVNLEGVSE